MDLIDKMTILIANRLKLELLALRSTKSDQHPEARRRPIRGRYKSLQCGILPHHGLDRWPQER
jgi:hypothetical protein